MQNVAWRPVIAELVGTFIFFFIGAGAICTDAFTKGAVGLLGIALAHGLALSIMVSAFGATSGGHFNPAVTIGMLVTRQIAPIQGAMYIVGQLVGGVLAGLMLRAIFAPSVWDPVHLGTPALSPGVDFGSGILIEAVLTFILLIAIWGTAVDPRAPKIGGFGIGLTVMMDILVGGPLTGAAMNPARTFGPAVAAGYFDNHLVYWIGPIIGAVIASLLYQNFFLPRADEAPVVVDPGAPTSADDGARRGGSRRDRRR